MVYSFAIALVGIEVSPHGREGTFKQVEGSDSTALLVTVEGNSLLDATRTLENRLSDLAQGHVLTNGKQRLF